LPADKYSTALGKRRHREPDYGPVRIPYYDEALFLQTIRTGYVKARSINQIMPWTYYRNLTDDDLKRYLRT